MRLLLLTTLTMSLFAANSLLCRLALAGTGMDASGYTVLRLVSGALTLWALIRLRGGRLRGAGRPGAALALFLYMAFFSWAYLRLPAAAGTLVFVVSIQAAMLGIGVRLGARPSARQIAGIGLAVFGVVVLLLPGLSAPPLGPSLLICCAGIAWGAYSIFGRSMGDPTLNTAGNFVRALPLTLLLLPFCSLPPLAGALYAVAAGAVASALGYVLWYALVARLSVPSAAVVQLSIPALTALGAYFLLGEPVTPRLALSTVIILAGIAWAEGRRRRS